MSETTVTSVRKIVAGAAHGAWSGLLVGVLLLMVTWALFVAVCTFAPELITLMTGTPIKDLWALTIHWYAALKLLLFGWVILASFLSYWWRAL